MRKVLKALAWGLGIVGVLLAVGGLSLTLLGMPEYDVPTIPLQVDQSPERVAQGRRLAYMLCIRCHYNTNTRQLEGAMVDRVPWRIRSMYSANLTQDVEHGLGGWSDGDIAFALRTGVNPKSGRLLIPVMPRWPRLATEDLEAIIAFLRSDDPMVVPSDKVRPELRTTLWAKYFAYVEWEPFAYPREEIPRPSSDDPVVFGEYLVNSVLQCAGCHNEVRSPSDTVDVRGEPGYLGGGMPLTGLAVSTVTSANLTPHSTGLAQWTEEELRHALVDGFRPDGEVLRWPMRRYPDLTDSDTEAIFAYLRTVPPISRVVPRLDYRIVGAKADAGLHAFQTYGCVHCHGKNGQGLVDFRGLDERFPTDEALTAFLREPATGDAQTVMPRWDGVVAEEDYAALCEISRRFAREQTERLGPLDGK